MPTTIPPMKLSVEMPVAVKETTKLVKVPLDADEQRKIGQAMANLMVQIEHLRDELALTVKSQREHIVTLQSTVRDAARSLCHGWQESLATVQVHYDFNNEAVKTYLKGKCIEDRAMTEDEKQLDLEMCLQQGMELKVLKPGPLQAS